MASSPLAPHACIRVACARAHHGKQVWRSAPPLRPLPPPSLPPPTPPPQGVCDGAPRALHPPERGGGHQALHGGPAGAGPAGATQLPLGHQPSAISHWPSVISH